MKYDFLYGLNNLIEYTAGIEDVVFYTHGLDAIKSINADLSGVEVECHEDKIYNIINELKNHVNIKVEMTDYIIMFRYRGIIFFAKRKGG